MWPFIVIQALLVLIVANCQKRVVQPTDPNSPWMKNIDKTKRKRGCCRKNKNIQSSRPTEKSTRSAKTNNLTTNLSNVEVRAYGPRRPSVDKKQEDSPQYVKSEEEDEPSLWDEPLQGMGPEWEVAVAECKKIAEEKKEDGAPKKRKEEEPTAIDMKKVAKEKKK